MSTESPSAAPRKKLPLKERYALLTRDLDWEPSYVDREQLYPFTRYEGIKIHDWDGWQDPFRLTWTRTASTRRRRTNGCTPCSTGSHKAKDI
jgi:hypothetical protein